MACSTGEAPGGAGCPLWGLGAARACSISTMELGAQVVRQAGWHMLRAERGTPTAASWRRGRSGSLGAARLLVLDGVEHVEP